MKSVVVFTLLIVGCLGCLEVIPKKKPKKYKYNCDHRAPQALVEKHKDLFDYVKGGDDVVTPSEVKVKMGAFTDNHGHKEFDITPEDAVEMVKQGDKDGDGVLSEKEWIAMFIEMAFKKYMPDFTQTFELFDRNGDFKVTEQELVKVLTNVHGVQSPHHLARKIMMGYECDGDKRLNLEEFVGFLASRKPKFSEDEYIEDEEEFSDEETIPVT